MGRFSTGVIEAKLSRLKTGTNCGMVINRLYVCKGFRGYRVSDPLQRDEKIFRAVRDAADYLRRRGLAIRAAL